MKRALSQFIILSLFLAGCSSITISIGSPDRTAQSSDEVDLSGYFLPDPTVGLDGLQSYSQSLFISLNVTQDGNTLAFTDSYSQDLNRASDTQFSISDITNPEGVQGKTVSGNIGEAYYSKLGDGKCKVSWGPRAEGVEPFVPAQLLLPLLVANDSGLEEINGIPTHRYAFDTTSLGFPSNTQTEGQVWLAVEGGYVVKYVMTIHDEDGLFGEGANGEQVFNYELSQINAGLEPELPEGCLAVLTDFSAMADAVDLQRLPGILAYTSPSDVSQIQSFYEQQLTGKGWIVGSSYPLQEGGTNLVFRQVEENKVAYISLQEAGANTWVTVQVQPLVEQ